MENNTINNKEKIVAFYLPQFHAIPENDEAWGKGFTEWTNVKKAKPIYKGQYQPHIPMNGNYYNLLDVNVMKEQAELAKKYGVYGFCYYHYYFKGGKKLLEKPLENMLADKGVDIPFCLSWANEPWSRRWDGSENEIIVEQDYGDKDEWKAHFCYLLDFFKDDRYMRDEKGRPIFLIYKPSEIPCCKEMMEYWNELAIKNNIPTIKYIVQHPELEVIEESIDEIFEGIVEFEPLYTSAVLKGTPKRKLKFVFTHPMGALRILGNAIYNKVNGTSRHSFSYDLVVKASLKRKNSQRIYPGVFPGWDNTPRRGKNATFFVGSTPEKFKKYLEQRISKNRDEYNKELLFVNAWNEWGEGAHLEPDEKYGCSYLEAVRDVYKDL